MDDVERPRLVGTVAVRGGRRLGFAESGSPHGEAIVWMHGTLLADPLGIGAMRLIGLSGGGPYVLAAGAALPERVRGVAVTGGVAPVAGPDAVPGGLLGVAARLAPVVSLTRMPLSVALTMAIRLAKPWAGRALDVYAGVQPEGDKPLLGRPEFRAMFVDDLRNGSRRQVSAPLSDLLLSARDWGLRLADVRVPVLWFHGDADHIVPFVHGAQVVQRLPDATLATMPGESHLGGLGLTEDILTGLMSLGE